MAIYTTFFLAQPHQLVDGFPGWKPPLPQPVRREIRNPFTKQLIIVETREPEWPEDSRSAAPPQFRAVAISGSFEAYLEGRLPRFVSDAEHWATKGLTDVEIQPLLRALNVTAKLESPLFAPRSSGAVPKEFPSGFIAALAECDQNQVASRWAAEMSTPEHTHSVSGRKVKEGWTVHQASQVLTSIASLAAKASSEQRLYLLIEA